MSHTPAHGTRFAFVQEAVLLLEGSTDPASVGAQVTAGLCGHWEHEGPCRWPHNNHIMSDGDHACFRTIFIAYAGDEREIRERIEQALKHAEGVTLMESQPRPVMVEEEMLAARLLRVPWQDDS